MLLVEDPTRTSNMFSTCIGLPAIVFHGPYFESWVFDIHVMVFCVIRIQYDIVFSDVSNMILFSVTCIQYHILFPVKAEPREDTESPVVDESQSTGSIPGRPHRDLTAGQPKSVADLFSKAQKSGLLHMKLHCNIYMYSGTCLWDHPITKTTTSHKYQNTIQSIQFQC